MTDETMHDDRPTRRKMLGTSAIAMAGGLAGAGLLYPETAAASPAQYNVQTYGATGDGSTDDTTSIQSALTAAKNGGGGTVYFPPGTYITRTLTIYSKFLLLGAGYGSTILKLKNGTNADVIQSENTNNDETAISAFGIADLTIDGNKANNTAGSGIKIHGYNYILRDIRVRRCAGDGIYSEWLDFSGAFPTDNDAMEAHLHGVKSHDNGANGITWKGPHDSMWVNVISFFNGTYGVDVGDGGASLQIINGHVYGEAHTNGYRLGVPSVILISCQSEGSTGAQILIAANDCQVIGGSVYNDATPPPSSITGIQIGVSGGAAVAGCMIHTQARGCKSGAINFANDAGGNVVRMTIYQDNIGGTLTPIAGTPHALTRVETVVLGLDGNYNWNVNPGNASARALQVNKGTGATPAPVFNVNATTPSVELLNGSRVVFGAASSPDGPMLMAGTGNPNNVVTAVKGSIFLRTDSAGSNLFVKESGTGNTGWVGK